MDLGPPLSDDHDVLPDRNTTSVPQCLVLTCSGAAEQMWRQVDVSADDDIGSWPVCREHYLKLTAGEPWQAARGGPRSFRRWLLMGDQLTASPQPLPGQRPRLVR